MGPFQDDERAAIEYFLPCNLFQRFVPFSSLCQWICTVGRAAKSVLKKTYESGKEDAMKSLQALSKADIATLKSYSKPPADVLSTMLVEKSPLILHFSLDSHSLYFNAILPLFFILKGIYLLLGHAKDDVDEWPEIKNQLKLMGKKATLYRLSQRNVMYA